ncbi:hypothetical protein, partial [Zemynaea arenosa]|uniref:hypothetical protein n=1 Tax=Zemynaea arenosa TaxID=2561931 RepID=UPI0014315B7E
EDAIRQRREPDWAPCLATFAAALAQLADAEHLLPPEPSPTEQSHGTAPPPPEGELRTALAHLLILLQNNNLKAGAAFQALRPHLAQAAPELVAALAEAIDTLGFAHAATLVEDLLNRKDSA